MEITWLKEGSFILKDNKNSIIINPITGTKAKGPFTTAVLLTSDHNEYATDIITSAGTKITDWPGEYEIGGCLIQGVEIPDTNDGTIHTAFSITSPEKITFAFLGSNMHGLSSSALEDLGNIDVLIIPITENEQRTFKNIHAVIDDIGPSYVIPAYYSSDEDFLSFAKNIGISPQEKKKSIKFTKSMVGGEIVVLAPLEKSE